MTSSEGWRTMESVVAEAFVANRFCFHRQYLLPPAVTYRGRRSKVDLFVPQQMGMQGDLIVEVKYQEVGGSAHEKVDYLFRKIDCCYPCRTIIVAGGLLVDELKYWNEEYSSLLWSVMRVDEIVTVVAGMAIGTPVRADSYHDPRVRELPFCD